MMIQQPDRFCILRDWEVGCILGKIFITRPGGPSTLCYQVLYKDACVTYAKTVSLAVPLPQK